MESKGTLKNNGKKIIGLQNSRKSNQQPKQEESKAIIRVNNKIEKIEPDFIPKNPKETPDYSIRFMCPSNLVEQQERFFANNCKVNPVFEYANFAAA